MRLLQIFKSFFPPTKETKEIKKDTLRLILFLECNMTCYYCCNDNERFNSKFIKKKLTDIDFSKYKNVCISGGEPFLYPQTVFNVLNRIPKRINIYLYTNGVLLSYNIIKNLRYYNIKGINIGIHQHLQLVQIPLFLDRAFDQKVRYCIQDTKIDELKQKYPRLHDWNTYAWHKDDCEMPNEDWVLLQDLPKEIGED